MKQIFLIRHCQAAGQEPEAPLTQEGIRQSNQLMDFLSDKNIDRIVSSPYKRAIDTIQPLSQAIGVPIIVDARLEERVLSSKHLENWMELLRATYENLDQIYEGGESSREAMNRGVAVIHEIMDRTDGNAVVVTHGALMSLILKHFDDSVGFEEWRSLTNPDVYVIRQRDGAYESERIWA